MIHHRPGTQPADDTARESVPAFIEVRGLYKSFNGIPVLKNLDLMVPKGKVITLLGPSGCGKTTTLRCIAGLEVPDGGSISIAGNITDDPSRHVAPRHRGLGIVFQSFALWPHMRVRENVAFPLRRKHMAEAEIARRSDAVLSLVGLAGAANRYPGELSGGQQQRVALARAVVAEPVAILYDEPLSNLDAKLREEMRSEIRDLHTRLGITAVYVTHDQEEAIDISDQIYVMRDGVVVQHGAPLDIFDRPRNKFVCEFFGQANVFAVAETMSVDQETVRVRTVGKLDLLCRAPLSPTAKPGHIAVRPHRVRITTVSLVPTDPAPAGIRSVNFLHGKILSVRHYGVRSRYKLALREGSVMDVDMLRPGHGFRTDEHVAVAFSAADCVCLED